MTVAEEEAADLRTYEEVKRRLAIGEEELIPAEFANRICAGESPVRVWREYRGLSVEELAGNAKVDPDELVGIEDGRRHGNKWMMKRLAAALNLDLDDLT